ncbi:MAG: hypothetical protein ACRDYX_22105 [Egibacteraceae bacterium]
MTPEQWSLLRDWLARLTLDPLDPTDPDEDRYVELQEAGRGAVDKIFPASPSRRRPARSSCQAPADRARPPSCTG